MPGHRDLGQTACPGRYAYGRLPSVRTAAWRSLRAVISTPVVSGAPVRSPEPVKVSATLDHTAYWRATITTDAGDVLATTTGRGTKIGVSWGGVLADGLSAPPGTKFRCAITPDDPGACAGERPARAAGHDVPLRHHRRRPGARRERPAARDVRGRHAEPAVAGLAPPRAPGIRQPTASDVQRPVLPHSSSSSPESPAAVSSTR